MLLDIVPTLHLRRRASAPAQVARAACDAQPCFPPDRVSSPAAHRSSVGYGGDMSIPPNPPLPPPPKRNTSVKTRPPPRSPQQTPARISRAALRPRRSSPTPP